MVNKRRNAGNFPGKCPERNSVGSRHDHWLVAMRYGVAAVAGPQDGSRGMVEEKLLRMTIQPVLRASLIREERVALHHVLVGDLCRL